MKCVFLIWLLCFSQYMCSSESQISESKECNYKPYMICQYKGEVTKKLLQYDAYKDHSVFQDIEVPQWSMKNEDQFNCTGMYLHHPAMYICRGRYVWFKLEPVANDVRIDPFDLLELIKELEAEKVQLIPRNTEYQKTIIFDFNNSMKMFHQIPAHEFFEWWEIFKEKEQLFSSGSDNVDNIDDSLPLPHKSPRQYYTRQYYMRSVILGIGVGIIFVMLMVYKKVLKH